MPAGLFNNRHHIIHQIFIHADAAGGLLNVRHFLGRHARLKIGHRIVGRKGPQDFLLTLRVRIAHSQAHQEAIQLGFGQRIGSVVLDGVLRGDHHERLGQGTRVIVHRHLRFVHGFKQRALGFGSGAVDFIGQHDVGENRARPEFKALRLLVVNVDADHVGGKHVGSELNALERAVKRARQRMGQGGLADAGNVFQQQMSAGQQSHQRQLHGLGFPPDDAFDGSSHSGD